MLCWNVRSFHAGSCKSWLLRWAVIAVADTDRGWETKVTCFVYLSLFMLFKRDIIRAGKMAQPLLLFGRSWVSSQYPCGN